MSLVRDCMFPNIATLSPDTTLLEAGQRMVRQAPGFAIILENMTLTGLVTDFDFIKWIAAGHDPKQVKISDLPSSPPQTVHEDTHCQDLLKIYYQRRFRRFPVLNDDEILSGGITEKQILAALPRSNLMAHYLVDDMVVSAPPAVPPNMPYMEVAKRMVSWHRGCVLVMEDESYLGIITEGDMLRYRVDPNWHENLLATDMASKNATTISQQSDLLQARDLFVLTKHRRMPVVDSKGQVIGLLTQTDLLRQVADSARSHQAVLNPEDITEPAIWFSPDDDNIILAMNEKGAKALELDPEEWVGQPVAPLAVDQPVWAAISTLLMSCGTIDGINLPLRTGNGNSLCVSCRFSLIHTPTGDDRVFWTIGAMEAGRKNCK
ncbi:MAG: CBS domain-containing protein [Magnetococcales bacterium]|nr:CBS domain-containing protein [Magnetococcales bacterium]